MVSYSHELFNTFEKGKPMKTLIQLTGVAVVGLGALALIVLITTFFVKIAWAYSITTIFGLKELTWTQAFALSALSSSLFKSSGIKFNKEKT